MASVLLVGDSLAVGLTKPLGDIARGQGDTFLGDGATGSTVTDWLTGKLKGRLLADMASAKPDLVLISLGTNDATGDLAGWGAKVAALVAQAKGAKSIVWIGPPFFADKLKNFPAGNVAKMRQILLDTLTPLNVPIFPSDAGGADNDYARSADGIHMTAAGFADWAKDVADFAQITPQVPRVEYAAPKDSNPVTPSRKGWFVALGLAAAAGIGALVYGKKRSK